MTQQTTINRFEIDEKNAIIALQAILTTRGVVSEEKYMKLGHYLSRIPPYRAMLFYGHALHAIAARMDEGAQHKEQIKMLAETITGNISPEFAEQVEEDPDYFEDQRQSLADNLNKISTLMQQFRKKNVA